MKKKLKLIISSMITTCLLLGGCGQAASNKTSQDSSDQAQSSDEKVDIGISSWIGFAPFFVADEKGIFKKNGVDVNLQMIQSIADRRTALAAGKLKGFGCTVDAHVITEAQGVDVTQVLALDTSAGGDGIVAKSDINDFKDLKGKQVAIDMSGGASYFWFHYLLDKNDMTIDDINVVNMSAGDAGAAFVAGKVDAAVTWQPWLSKAKETSFGHVLMDSTETPGVIVDSLAFSENFVKENPETVQKIVDSWFDALDFIKSNPDEANQIMAKGLGQTKEDFEATLSEVEFYDKSKNKEYFGTEDKKGALWDVCKSAEDLWYKTKVIDNEPDIKNVIDGSFIN
ncbi:ABC transporter substrate-binding protein [Clostridium butyricum]|jgi:NitT/TauT family transport system substrate-binding protein|nr:MAG: Aliphatic sulfonates family ABC transporter, periplasmic ligand-binding protein [Clostridium butyricum DORA_1]MDU1509940.1 ABC transporter substrate-binding protein [Clostridium butyricum]MDU4802293.1 ABC transporter substrate-binding protein [Clostridium butyricum]